MFEAPDEGYTGFPHYLRGYVPNKSSAVHEKTGWKFTKLLTQIHKIFRSFQMLLQSNYSYYIKQVIFFTVVNINFY
jgi:hypothetical protein